MARLLFGFTVLMLSLVSDVSTNNAHAVEGNVYGVLSAGFARTDVDEYELDEASYKIAIGYELSPQWYLEGAFVSFGELNAGGSLTQRDSAQENDGVAEVTGLSLSALGKARNRYGDLFYRVGLMRADVNATTFADETCSGSLVRSAVGEQLCQYDNTVLAGVVGLGFDYFVHHSAMIRFEVDYSHGEDDFSAVAAYVGVRVNF